MSELGAVSRGLRRLLQLRHLEEKQCRVALEAALAELHRLERAHEAAGERNRRSRFLIQRGVLTGDLADRIAGIEEGRAALLQAAMLEAATSRSRETADALRERYQSSRVERRQVETLIREAEADVALAAGRRSQQSLDDWYGSRHQIAETAANRAKSGFEIEKLEDKSNGSS